MRGHVGSPFLLHLAVRLHFVVPAMNFRVVSYNLLVPIYADQPEYYSKCHPEHLQTNFRLKLILTQLEREMTQQRNVIFCLQELCQTFVELLLPFFQRHKYQLIFRLYGQAHNDYMGVGIAVPNSLRVHPERPIRVGEYVRPLGKAAEPKRNFLQRFRHFLGLDENQFPPGMSSVEMARAVKNQLLIIDVEAGRDRLSIGTYHMPCMYKHPEVMQMHAAAVRHLMVKHAGNYSWILAGDFNFAPDDPCYQLICHEHVHSAYERVNGTEPNYTNFAKTAGSPVFCATLDYIFFCGRNLRVNEILPLPEQPEGDSYPDAQHPSDHLLIAASFHFI